MNIIKKFSLLLILITWNSAFSQEVGSVTGLSLPRFVALKSAETNLRKGPNLKFPIEWSYKCKGYPMELIAEFENWRKLRDFDGSEGWIHENLITGNRNVYIKSNIYITKNELYLSRKAELILFRYPEENSYPMARLQIGVLGKLKKCHKEWCKIKVENSAGWVRKINLWGVNVNEIIE